MKKLMIILTLMLLIMMLAGCGAGDEAIETTAPAEPAATEPEQAPDFTVLDGEGNEVQLSDFFGKPIVLNFWATWCGPCKSEMPEFNEAYLEQGEAVQFLMVNLTDGTRDTVDSVKAFIEEAGYSFPVFYDTTYDAATVYGVSAIPMTLFIDADGVLQAYANQAIDMETLQKGIGMVTSKE